MSFLFNDAFAEAAGNTSAGSATTSSTTQGLLSMLPMVFFLIICMYFLVVRPQTKKAKEHKQLMGSLQVGNEVITIGGVLGKIDKITGDLIVLNIADGANIIVQKSAIANVIPRGTIKSAL